MRDKVKESELWSEAFIMVKIGMFLPEERMVEPARKIIEENHLDVVYLEAVHTIKQELQWRPEPIFWLPEDIRRS